MKSDFVANPFLIINSRKVYFSELANQSYLETVPADGYEAKTLEFCANWLRGLQEIPVQTSGSTGVPRQSPRRGARIARCRTGRRSVRSWPGAITK